MDSKDDRHKYDVALSFAGEQRQYVKDVANALKNKGIEVFYDEYNQVDMWGENLVDHFEKIFGEQASYIVMFLSKEYAAKGWPDYERQVVLSRWIKERSILLPVRFDKSKIKGLPDSIGYIGLEKMSPEELAKKIIEKVHKSNSSRVKSDDVDFLLPKKVNKINPYKERSNFILTVENELKRRCQQVPELEFYSEDVGDRRRIRILYYSDLLYSLDIEKGGISGDQGVSFSLGGSGYNAWGDFKWSSEKNSPILNISDFGIFGVHSGEGEITYNEFADNSWKKIVEEIERHNNQ